MEVKGAAGGCGGEHALAGDLAAEGSDGAMDGVLDLERLLGRVALDSAGPREVMAQRLRARWCLPGLVAAVKMFGAVAERWVSVADVLEDSMAVW